MPHVLLKNSILFSIGFTAFINWKINKDQKQLFDKWDNDQKTYMDKMDKIIFKEKNDF